MTYHSIEELKPVVEFLVASYPDHYDASAKKIFEERKIDVCVHKLKKTFSVILSYTYKIDKNGEHKRMEEFFVITKDDTHKKLEFYVKESLELILNAIEYYKIN